MKLLMARAAGTAPRSAWVVACALALSSPVGAQEASFVHRLGDDTVAVEQYTRAGNRVTGEVASRLGAAVTRMQYEVTLDANGRPTSATFRTRSGAGAQLPNQPSEVRLAFAGDSIRREAVYPDSVNVRTLYAASAFPYERPAFGLYEVALGQLRRSGAQSATFATVNSGGGNPAQVTLTVMSGDSVRGSDNMIYRADREGRLLAVDATHTTQKFTSERETRRHDLTAIAARMTPLGTLSGRGLVHGSFMQSVVFIDYGRPLVRGRTTWGGLLVPRDTIWRAGANEATHLATGRELVFGDVSVPAGLYTLFVFNSSAQGPLLVVNRQVGQWGTGYDASRDLARIPLQLSDTPAHVEEFTIDIRNMGGGRGAIDLIWADKRATATFTVR
jgi:hypothetical protein